MKPLYWWIVCFLLLNFYFHSFPTIPYSFPLFLSLSMSLSCLPLPLLLLIAGCWWRAIRMTAGTVVITGGILATVILLLIIAVLCYCRLQVRPQLESASVTLIVLSHKVFRAVGKGHPWVQQFVFQFVTHSHKWWHDLSFNQMFTSG